MKTNCLGEREYLVTGDRVYTIWAKSRTSAIRRAAIRYKEELQGEYPAEFYDQFFTRVEAQDWDKTGPKGSKSNG